MLNQTPAANSAFTVRSKCSTIASSPFAGSPLAWPARWSCGRRYFPPRLIAGAARPADRPGMARHDMEGADDQREHRVAGRRADRFVKGDIVFHDPDRLVEIPLHRFGNARRFRRPPCRCGRMAASTTVRRSTVRRTSKICWIVTDRYARHGRSPGPARPPWRSHPRAPAITDVDQRQRGERTIGLAHDAAGYAPAFGKGPLVGNESPT